MDHTTTWPSANPSLRQRRQRSLSLTTAVVGLVTLFMSTTGSAQTVLHGQSEITFVTRQMGVPVEGQFRRFDAQVQFDPKKPETARIGFTVDLASARIGTAETEAELAKPDWFNTKAFPQASFQSTAVKGLGSGRFEVAGKLSIKGQARDVLIPVNWVQASGSGTASGSFTIKRLDFRIGDGDWKDTAIVANDVSVRFKLTLNGLPPP